MFKHVHCRRKDRGLPHDLNAQSENRDTHQVPERPFKNLWGERPALAVACLVRVADVVEHLVRQLPRKSRASGQDLRKCTERLLYRWTGMNMTMFGIEKPDTVVL